MCLDHNLSPSIAQRQHFSLASFEHLYLANTVGRIGEPSCPPVLASLRKLLKQRTGFFLPFQLPIKSWFVSLFLYLFSSSSQVSARDTTLGARRSSERYAPRRTLRSRRSARLAPRSEVSLADGRYSRTPSSCRRDRQRRRSRHQEQRAPGRRQFKIPEYPCPEKCTRRIS